MKTVNLENVGTLPDFGNFCIEIIADDQGYGDLGITGNPYVKTPNDNKIDSKSLLPLVMDQKGNKNFNYCSFYQI